MSDHEFNLERFEMARALGRRIAHDLNNALGVISAHSSLALMSAGDDPDLKEDIEAMRDAGRRAAILVREMMALLPPTQDRVGERAVNTVVSGVEGLLRRVLGEGVELNVTLAQDDTTALCNEVELRFLLLFLARRAREAMGDGGMVRLEITRAEIDEGEAAHGGVPAGPCVRIEFSSASEAEGDSEAMSRMRALQAVAERSGGVMQMGRVDGGTTVELFYPLAEGGGWSAVEANR